jgi:hypothetical protein
MAKSLANLEPTGKEGLLRLGLQQSHGKCWTGGLDPFRGLKC